jgi:hypothetical protein
MTTHRMHATTMITQFALENSICTVYVGSMLSVLVIVDMHHFDSLMVL